MSEKLMPCKRCKCTPQVVEISGLFYVQCHGVYDKKTHEKGSDGTTVERTTRVKCGKWHAYEFLGNSRRAAIESWNYANTHKTLAEEE